jgi:hypothetical protein
MVLSEDGLDGNFAGGFDLPWCFSPKSAVVSALIMEKCFTRDREHRVHFGPTSCVPRRTPQMNEVTFSFAYPVS